MPQPWQTGVVTKIQDETANTRRFWIQLPLVNHFEFQAGQFVTLNLPISDQPGKCLRSYSIASWPNGSNEIELVIVLLEGGAGTHYLFHHIAVGSELMVRGPLGNFTLPDPIDSDIYFICTGTDIAPFRSMVHYIAEHNIPHQNIYLIFGCRKKGDCLYGPELKEMERKLPQFRYLPTFSREEAGDHLVRVGYVHDVYEEILKENGTKKAQFYLCGWRAMVDEAKQRIQALGYDKKLIHQELYG